MAQLDPLLNAVVDRDADELILVEGERPALRSGDALRPLSPKILNRPQITKLLAELANQIDMQRIAAGEAVDFEYLSANGAGFRCEARADEQPMRVRFAPADVSVPGPRAAVPISGGMEADFGPDSIETSPGRASTSASTQAHTSASTPGSAPESGSIQAAAQPAAAPAGPTISPRPGAPEIETLLIRMVQEDCSDLHLSSGERPLFRKDGEIAPVGHGQVLEDAQVRNLLEPITPERNREEFDDTHDTDYAYEIEGLARFRVNMFKDRKGVGAVFRQIPSKILTAEQLNLPDSILRLCNLTKGLILVTGPTGSGKSTTLAAMIDHVNRSRADHIITIEDPIEFVHDNQKCLVNQREVITHTGSFKSALRAALREDPDIVLVGELRDLETIAIAIETAETGHLVFGTLHTNTACSTVDRIIDQFPSDRQAQIRTMLSESIRGVVSQQLLKKKGGGRVAALEVLVVTSAIANLIREGKTFQIPSLMQTGRRIGMRTMTDALLDLVKSDLVDPKEALRRSTEKSTVEKALQKLGHDVKVEDDL